MERPQRQVVDGGVHGPVELGLRRQEAEIAERAHDALRVVALDVDVGRLDVEVEEGAAIRVAHSVQPAQADDDVAQKR